MPKCRYCQGSGKIASKDIPDGMKKCPDCQGARMINDAPCAKCEGRGFVPKGFLEKLVGKTEGEPCPYCDGKGWR